MKVVYNSKEIGDNYNNYNRLVNKPLINSVELVGNITLNDINVYTKDEVKRLISSARSVKTAINLPSPLTPNTTYYIGPNEHNIYTVYLTDSSDPINAFVIGTTSFGKYYSGEGIDVTDPGNVVSVLTDDESVIVNSEGLLEARPVFEKMVPFKGATIPSDGTQGIVPKPEAGDQDSFLFGNATWKNTKEICDLVHPVGSLFMTVPFTTSPANGNWPGGAVTDAFPATLGPGTTWVRLDPNKCLQTDDTGGSVIEQKVPNIKGTASMFLGKTSGATYSRGYGSHTYDGCYGSLNFDSSRNGSIYNGSLVRPPAANVWVWRRTA